MHKGKEDKDKKARQDNHKTKIKARPRRNKTTKHDKATRQGSDKTNRRFRSECVQLQKCDPHDFQPLFEKARAICLQPFIVGSASYR
jgi:hypothetical protein